LPKALIEGHPESNLLARIFVETGRFPNEVYNLPRGERALVYASIITGAKFKGGGSGAATAKNVKTMLAKVRTAKGLPSGGT
jgi:hypothetical protein